MSEDKLVEAHKLYSCRVEKLIADKTNLVEAIAKTRDATHQEVYMRNEYTNSLKAVEEAHAEFIKLLHKDR